MRCKSAHLPLRAAIIVLVPVPLSIYNTSSLPRAQTLHPRPSCVPCPAAHSGSTGKTAPCISAKYVVSSSSVRCHENFHSRLALFSTRKAKQNRKINKVPPLPSSSPRPPSLPSPPLLPVPPSLPSPLSSPLSSPHLRSRFPAQFSLGSFPDAPSAPDISVRTSFFVPSTVCLCLCASGLEQAVKIRLLSLGRVL